MTGVQTCALPISVPWKQRLGFHSLNAAYLMLLDQRGIVRWRHNGLFDEDAYAELSRRVLALTENKP